MKRKTGYTSSKIKAPVSPELVLLAALILGIAISLGDIHFFSRGEGREALNALSALRGEWLLPRGYGGVVASKPPLLHWMIAAFGWWNGSISEMAARLPSFLAAGGVTWFLLRRVPTSRRWFVALVLVTSFEWVRAAVSCRVDMVHAAFLGGALLLWPTLRTSKKGTTPLLVLGGLLTAASTLAKGPVALALSSLVFLGWFWIEERKLGVSIALFLRRFSIWQGVAFAVAGFWYGAAFILGGDEFRDTVLSENVGRFTSTMKVVPHQHGVWYLAATLAAGLLPWTIVMLRAALRPLRSEFSVGGEAAKPREWRLVSRLRRGRAFLQSQIAALPALDRYALLVGALVFAFYSIPGSKRGVYLLVGYPFYAIIIGRLIERGLAGRDGVALRRWFSGALLGLTGILIILSLLSGIILMVEGVWVTSPFFAGITGGGIPQWVHRVLVLLFEMGVGSGRILGLMALAVGAFYGWYLWRMPADAEAAGSYQGVAGSLAPQSRALGIEGLRASVSSHRIGAMRSVICCLTIILIVQTNVQTPLSISWSERLIAEQIRLVVPPEAPLVSWHRDFYGASLYAERRITGADPVPREGEYCVVRGGDLEELRSELPKPLQPNFVAQIVRGFGGSDTVLIVKIEPPGAGLGSV